MNRESNHIRITAEEANSEHVDDLLKRQASLRGEGGVTRSRRRKWYYNSWVGLSIAGALFGLLSWSILEPFYTDAMLIRGTITSVSPENNSVEGLETAGRMSLDGQKLLLLDETDYYVDQSKGMSLQDLNEGDSADVYVTQYSSTIDSGIVARVVVPSENPGALTQSLSKQSQVQDAIGLVFFALVASIVGMGLGLADGLMCRAMRRAVLGALAGLVIGFIGGFVSGNLANIVYSPFTIAAQSMRDADGGITPVGFVVQTIGRAIGWAMAGMTMGLGPGIIMRSGKLLLYGTIGGLIGGMIGGLLFDPIQHFVVGRDALQADYSRMIGIICVGGFVGLMIGVVELLARDAWLNMVRGPLAGKEFLVFKDVVKIGSAPSSDIYLFNDEEVAKNHAVIRAMSDQYEIEAVGNHSVTINGRTITKTRLRHGDQIQLGTTLFAFQRRNSD